MKAGMAALVLAYILSQFYRVFLAVLAPTLQAGIGVGPDALSRASGLWFLTFALMQFPVGWALDRVGPRATVSVLMGIGSAGALIFGLASGPVGISLGMALIGVGCSPVLMASYYIIARTLPPALFATLAGAIIGIGGLGNLGGSVPLAMAVTAFGWRPTVLGLAGITLLTALLLALRLRDPVRHPQQARAEPGSRAAPGSLHELLRIRALWPILPMMAVTYGPAVAVRGLWVGPYLTDAYGTQSAGIGQVTLLMALAMIAGNFAYGPADRWLGNRKAVVLGGTVLGAVAFALLALWPASGLVPATLLLAVLGFMGASFGTIMAHGRAFIPAHLLGRGVTLINFFGIAGAGLMQAASGPLHRAGGYPALFGFFALLLLAGSACYAFSANRAD